MSNPIDNAMRLVRKWQAGELDLDSLSDIDKRDLKSVPLATNHPDFSNDTPMYGGLTVREVRQVNELAQMIQDSDRGQNKV